MKRMFLEEMSQEEVAKRIHEINGILDDYDLKDHWTSEDRQEIEKLEKEIKNLRTQLDSTGGEYLKKNQLDSSIEEFCFHAAVELGVIILQGAPRPALDNKPGAFYKFLDAMPEYNFDNARKWNPQDYARAGIEHRWITDDFTTKYYFDKATFTETVTFMIKPRTKIPTIAIFDQDTCKAAIEDAKDILANFHYSNIVAKPISFEVISMSEATGNPAAQGYTIRVKFTGQSASEVKENLKNNNRITEDFIEDDNKLVGYLIDQTGGRQVEVSNPDVEGHLSEIYKLLDCDVFDIKTVEVGNSTLDLFVDDEGLLKNNSEGCIVHAFCYDPFDVVVGNILILGYDEEGNTISLTEHDIKNIKNCLGSVNKDISLDNPCGGSTLKFKKGDTILKYKF